MSSVEQSVGAQQQQFSGGNPTLVATTLLDDVYPIIAYYCTPIDARKLLQLRKGFRQIITQNDLIQGELRWRLSGNLFLRSEGGGRWVRRSDAEMWFQINLDNGLEWAARNGHVDIVRKLLPQATGDGKSDALVAAARAGFTSVVECLTDGEAARNIDSYALYEALAIAASNGHVDMVQLLLGRCNPEDSYNFSLVYEEVFRKAKTEGYSSRNSVWIEIGKLLVNAGTTGWRWALPHVATLESSEMVRFLIEKGADVHHRNDAALVHAASSGKLDSVRLLLDAGAAIHTKNDAALRGAVRTAVELQEAMLQGEDLLREPERYAERVSTVQLLLELGADVHALEDEPLRTACLWPGCPEIVQSLIEHGANIHARNDEAVHGAQGSTVIVGLLLEAGVDVNARDGTALKHAARQGMTDTVHLLLLHGVDVRKGFGGTALLDATEGGHAEIARLLLDAGAGREVFSTGEQFRDDLGTALLVAARKGYTEIVQMIIDAGVATHAGGVPMEFPRLPDGKINVFATMGRPHNKEKFERSRSLYTCVKVTVENGKTEVFRRLLDAGIVEEYAKSGRAWEFLKLAKDPGYQVVMRMLQQLVEEKSRTATVGAQREVE
ncbi:hypothetical protein HDV00_009994 [Rhizophlyctis rosea]|nr:hypothetical protein HDV00_009994 [Rhizophlyctis rosea]